MRAPDVVLSGISLPVANRRGQPAVIHGGGDNVLGGEEKLHKMGPLIEM
jgi:hypothetical protein